jgi:hypothetical protein
MMMVGEGQYPCFHPANEFVNPPELRLRSLVNYSSAGDDGGSHRLLRGDGLVEFCLVHPKPEPSTSGPKGNQLYVAWVIGLLVGAIAQIHQLRTKLAWDGVQFGVEMEIFGRSPLNIRLTDSVLSSGGREIQSALPLLLPRYSIDGGVNFDPLIETVIRDLWNASGGQWKPKCSVPWSSLL